MKKRIALLFLITAGSFLLAITDESSSLREGMTSGDAGIRSISAMAFGPDGILFIGDSKNATVYAIDTRDNTKVDKAAALELKKFDQKVAAALGADAAQVTITEVAVNPVSKKVYCAVQMADGTPALLRIDGDQLSAVDLKSVSFSSIALTNAPAEDAKDQRGRALRPASISDLGFFDGKVMVSGLSNQEFSSTFRVIPYPFTNKQDWVSLEMYHAAHKQYETFSPIRTFTVGEVNGKKSLIASYTCTPLVVFPLEDLKPGTHVKGRTVAEMGSGNSPLDMITMTKGNESYLLMANSSRPVFKVKYSQINAFQGTITTPVEESFATAGVDFVSLPVVSVLQMEKLDDTQFIMLQRKSNGDLDLWTASERYL
jgi:hypothetical protein